MNETGRNGILISLSKIKTCDEFERIFYETKINRSTNYDPGELCIIFEDCDAFDNNVLYSRKESNNDLKIEIDSDNESNKNDDNKDLMSYNKITKKLIDATKDNNSLNLSCVLNVLDGVIELHGLMVIFTTNHPEKLDEAFKRKGRINYTLDFKRANKNIILSLLKIDLKFLKISILININ